MKRSDDQQIARIRAGFRIFRKKIYLNSCSQGALSDSVEEGLREYLESWDTRGSPWDLWVEKYEQARNLFARMIGAGPDEVAIVPSASVGIHAVASALHYSGRNKIVMGEFEFPTMGHVWLAQRPRGAEIEFVEASGDRLPAANYEKHVDARTQLVPVTGVCFMNGFRSEVASIVEMARHHGAWVMLDDYQDCGTRPVDVHRLGVDFYVAGTLKYLLGPPGLAFVYVRRELIEQLVPAATGWFAQKNPFAFDVKRYDPSPTARRFEAGSPQVPVVYGVIRGLELLNQIGLETVAAQVKRLAGAMLTAAKELGIRAKTPPDSVGPLVVLQSTDSAALVEQLARHDIVASSRHDGVRLSFHVYNTLADVEAVAEVLRRNLPLLVRDTVFAKSH